MVRSPQGRPLSEDVNRTSRTRSGTSSRLWQERVRTPWAGFSRHAFGVLFFVVPLHSITDPPSYSQGAPRAGIRRLLKATARSVPPQGGPGVSVWTPSHPSHVGTPCLSPMSTLTSPSALPGICCFPSPASMLHSSMASSKSSFIHSSVWASCRRCLCDFLTMRPGMSFNL